MRATAVWKPGGRGALTSPEYEREDRRAFDDAGHEPRLKCLEALGGRLVFLRRHPEGTRRPAERSGRGIPLAGRMGWVGGREGGRGLGRGEVMDVGVEGQRGEDVAITSPPSLG